MNLETALILVSLVFGVLAGIRMLGRAARVVWARFVSNVWTQRAWAWVVAWGQAPDHYVESEEQHAPSLAVVSQTDRAPDQTGAAASLDVTKPTREQLLTLYTAMRAHGFSREAARAALRGVAPLDNNLWAEAAPQPTPPPDTEDIVTPYAGRRTKASYYPDDPDLEYRDLPEAKTA